LSDRPCSGDATGGHIDGIARFIDANRVVVGNCTVNGHCQPGGPDDQVYDATAANLAAAGFDVIRMDFEAAISHGGETFDADYLNWGVGNGWVIIVGFDNAATDNAAKAKLEGAEPPASDTRLQNGAGATIGQDDVCALNRLPRSSAYGASCVAQLLRGASRE